MNNNTYCPFVVLYDTATYSDNDFQLIPTSSNPFIQINCILQGVRWINMVLCNNGSNIGIRS